MYALKNPNFAFVALLLNIYVKINECMYIYQYYCNCSIRIFLTALLEYLECSIREYIDNFGITLYFI